MHVAAGRAEADYYSFDLLGLGINGQALQRLHHRKAARQGFWPGLFHQVRALLIPEPWPLLHPFLTPPGESESERRSGTVLVWVEIIWHWQFTWKADLGKMPLTLLVRLLSYYLIVVLRMGHVYYRQDIISSQTVPRYSCNACSCSSIVHRPSSLGTFSSALS